MSAPMQDPDLCAEPVTHIPGVGPRTAMRLARLGIHTVRDLVYHFPLRYEQTADAFSDGPPDGRVTVVRGTVCGPVSVRFSGRRCTVSVPLHTGTAKVKALFFNQPYLRHQLLPDVSLRIRGKWNRSSGTFAVAAHEILRDGAAAAGLDPVYPVTDGLSNQALRRYVAFALRECGSRERDGLPAQLRTRFRLVGRVAALGSLHQPADEEALRQARRRIVFEEFLAFQLRLQNFRRYRGRWMQTPLDGKDLARGAQEFVDRLPFALTPGQETALAECLRDVAGTEPMHRMIQGDVGSGKTAVAFALFAGLARIGWQSALMAPTGILAAQHHQEAARLLVPCGVRIGALSASQPPRERERVLEGLRSGNIDLLIGTHALVSPDVVFHRLRLAVVDEQHRFGVSARRLLRGKGEWSDVLQLSATPIPRSLALTIYGDVDMSTIRELPPGRTPVRTVLVRRTEVDRVVRMLRRELAKGRQAFIVAPRIGGDGEEDGGEVTSAVLLHAQMQEELAGWRVALVHGAMASAERDAAMADFVAGRAGALVATSIVEVGVSVPNASVMVVHDAHRFGLATLHQLRGRVGRGTHASLCVLVGDPATQAARTRLQAMLETSDGFVLAEQDLLLRGPGEVMGSRQSGLPQFRVGDVVADLRVMTVARDVAEELLRTPDFWLLPMYEELRRAALAEDDDAFADS